MINDIIVVDDAISKSYQDLLVHTIIDNREFPWFFSPAITGSKMFNDPALNKKDTPGWAHKFFDHELKGITSSIAELLIPIVHEACGKIDFYPKQLLHGRVFSLMPKLDQGRNVWHVDMMQPHLVCVYYVNDATGPTIISSESAEVHNRQFIDRDVDFPVAKTVEPKKGRAVLFDGRFYHTSTNPDDDRRVIIDFDVI
jgi:ectoine hydroxylase-related dioxygenase (phytanoyl-CoA dioxygenase family)